ncbi:M14 family zinc carboxypeptidase [Nocardioides plantarum]|uniref:M14 family zinc carboxypeptidase n=1 Tax=Nocardioides plantarum TaxID=29299 RepID=A0ABV5K953_9ACTN|nr:M14 family zinc carboxypeptidase [Nocardioides plantarum]
MHSLSVRFLALLLLVVALVVPPGAPASAAGDPAAFEKRILGRSVGGRPIVAYHLGQPDRPGVKKVVLFSTMHGNERDTRLALAGLVKGPTVAGLDLWVVPVYNPDGYAAGSRRNARGVDLNRNFSYGWKDLDGNYESGSGPASEPETKAAMTFLRRVDPDYVLSFHQPLYGVDIDTKTPSFARKVASTLRLPTQNLDCGGVCHGTMTGWFNRYFDGTALTVEYGTYPSRSDMEKNVPDRILRIFGAIRGDVSFGPVTP